MHVMLTSVMLNLAKTFFLPTTIIMPSVHSILSNPNIYDNILSDLNPLAKYRLGSISQLSHQAVNYFDKRAFNINRHLSPFFTNPISFRNLQRRTGTIISGSNALQFFDRTHFNGADLDLYVHPGHAGEVCDWLRESAGYRHIGGDEVLKQALVEDCKVIPKCESHMEDGYDCSPSIRGALQFWLGEEDELRMVHLMITRHSPMHAVLNFHSSKLVHSHINIGY